MVAYRAPEFLRRTFAPSGEITLLVVVRLTFAVILGEHSPIEQMLRANRSDDELRSPDQ
jgi:hypothetical protein